LRRVWSIYAATWEAERGFGGGDWEGGVVGRIASWAVLKRRGQSGDNWDMVEFWSVRCPVEVCEVVWCEMV
jgi:hypothetical protein